MQQKKYVEIFLKEIARDEDVAETTLTRYIEKYGDIDKAVFMAEVYRISTKWY